MKNIAVVTQTKSNKRHIYVWRQNDSFEFVLDRIALLLPRRYVHQSIVSQKCLLTEELITYSLVELTLGSMILPKDQVKHLNWSDKYLSRKTDHLRETTKLEGLLNRDWRKSPFKPSRQVLKPTTCHYWGILVKFPCIFQEKKEFKKSVSQSPPIKYSKLNKLNKLFKYINTLASYCN